MSHPFQDSLEIIERDLIKLTLVVKRMQSEYPYNRFINIGDFQELMKAAPLPARDEREQVILRFCDINTAIYCKIARIHVLLEALKSSIKKK